MDNPFVVTGAEWVSPSLNRVRLAGLAGELLPSGAENRLACELLSRSALQSMIRPQAKRMQLDPDQPDLLLDFDRCFTAASAAVRESAQGVALEYGRRLGYLLLTLKRGDDASQKARPEWRPAHWAHWRSVKQIWLGGGLVSGQLGPWAVRQAQELLHRAGISDLRLRLGEDPVAMPLWGAARYAGPTAQAVLVMDFGQTLVKRGCAFYEKGTLHHLIQFPALVSPCQGGMALDPLPTEIRRQAKAMIRMMSDTWDEVRQMGIEPDPAFFVSLACHLDQGQPYPTQLGCYGRLQRVTSRLPKYLAAGLSQRLGQPLSMQLIQDGTAAAALAAGQPATAILMLGTAIGIGFPPPAEGLRPLAPRLEGIG